MKQGERQRLYRSCWHLVVITLALLGGGLALRAQHTDTSASRPGEPSLAADVLDRAGHTGRSRNVPLGKLAVNGDSIIAGSRDFLEPNAPNPFGATIPSTKISYAISEESHVVITIYDFFYEEVVTLVDAVQPTGYYTVTFVPPPTMPSGMYFYEMRTGRTRELRRMMYMK